MRWLWVLALAACSPESVNRDFDAYLDTVNSCVAASDCTVIFTDCPLGCFHAVRNDQKADAEAEAARLVTRYRSSGQSCAYDCATPGAVTCSQQRCAIEAAP